jgi:uncharacterized protein
MNVRSAVLASALPFALALLAAPGEVHAAGFNCKYAKTEVETLICTDLAAPQR